jgi:hypothetical protein
LVTTFDWLMVGLSYFTCVFFSGKTFHLIPWLFYLWPSSLTYFSKTFTLVITFDWLVVGLAYFTCVFLLARPFIWYHDRKPLTFDRGFDLFKNFSRGHNFDRFVVELSYSSGKTFHLMPWLWPSFVGPFLT